LWRHCARSSMVKIKARDSCACGWMVQLDPPRSRSLQGGPFPVLQKTVDAIAGFGMRGGAVLGIGDHDARFRPRGKMIGGDGAAEDGAGTVLGSCWPTGSWAAGERTWECLCQPAGTGLHQGANRRPRGRFFRERAMIFFFCPRLTAVELGGPGRGLSSEFPPQARRNWKRCSQGE